MPDKKVKKYGIRAIFEDLEDGGERRGFTYYPEVTFNSIKETLIAINGEYGDLLVMNANLETEIELDLKGLYFSELEPYLITEEEECQK